VIKQRIHLLIVFGCLALGIGFVIYSQKLDSSRKLTFEACANAGGKAWAVDPFHPDICPACAEYRACETAYNDFREACPECYGACQECQDQYSLAESCPECYGPCQACENQYFNDFENDEERYALCPECKACEACREEINLKKAGCAPCISCSECKEENKRYSDIGEVCPQVTACTECMEANFPYPDTCPDGREKIGEISDAATWFQCCR
jgi:hypothetical protein